jgi:hypothetical protein
MSERIASLREKAFRALTWSSLVAGPALAVAAVGPALSATFNAEPTGTIARGVFPSEARAVCPPAGRANDPQTQWENTLRAVYVPPPRTTYTPPAPVFPGISFPLLSYIDPI